MFLLSSQVCEHLSADAGRLHGTVHGFYRSREAPNGDERKRSNCILVCRAPCRRRFDFYMCAFEISTLEVGFAL